MLVGLYEDLGLSKRDCCAVQVLQFRVFLAIFRCFLALEVNFGDRRKRSGRLGSSECWNFRVDLCRIGQVLGPYLHCWTIRSSVLWTKIPWFLRLDQQFTGVERLWHSFHFHITSQLFIFLLQIPHQLPILLRLVTSQPLQRKLCF